MAAWLPTDIRSDRIRPQKRGMRGKFEATCILTISARLSEMSRILLSILIKYYFKLIKTKEKKENSLFHFSF